MRVDDAALEKRKKLFALLREPRSTDAATVLYQVVFGQQLGDHAICKVRDDVGVVESVGVPIEFTQQTCSASVEFLAMVVVSACAEGAKLSECSQVFSHFRFSWRQ
jgi:hypothetical protein